MSETKKGLRITAGVILLVLACFALAMSVITAVTMLRQNSSMVRYYWQSMVSGALSLVLAILILARKFTGAGVVKCLMLAVSIAAEIVISIVPMLQNGISVTVTAPDLLLWFAELVPAILMIVALFLHSRASKPLLLISAILSLGLNAAQQARMISYYVQEYDFSNAMRIYAPSLGISTVQTIAALIAWILLAVYFGAQRKSETL